MLEIRQVFEAEDFGSNFTPELREQENRVREQVARQQGSRKFSRRFHKHREKPVVRERKSAGFLPMKPKNNLALSYLSSDYLSAILSL